MRAIRELIPVPEYGEQPTATVLRIQGKPRRALAKVCGGGFREREWVTGYRREGDRILEYRARITALRLITPRGVEPVRVVAAGDIVEIGGITGIRVGDQLGSPKGLAERPTFGEPPLSTVVTAREPARTVRCGCTAKCKRR